MSKIIYITGGERSGKSTYAQNKALELSHRPVYLATARIWDADFAARIERHKQERDNRWSNVEEEKYLSRHQWNGQVVLLDCVTLWLTNFFADCNYNYQQALEEAKTEWNKLVQQDFTLIVVSNEIGMGVHSESEGGRKFVELQGRMNQHIAQMASEAWMMVSGLPLKLK
jgi:adenosylcobinamide kinase/adenosylcobinamide-phosphate guanylyltransferase